MVEYPSCFESTEWLKGQILSILNFYAENCLDEQDGGYLPLFSGDGNVKCLSDTARRIDHFSIGCILGNRPAPYLHALTHGLGFLQEFHLDRRNGGYFWSLRDRIPEDSAKYAAGHAFVLSAAARACQAGVAGAAEILDYTFNLLEEHFYEPAFRLYANEASADWSEISPYRGQAANMYLCAAMTAAYEATFDPKYLGRACELAEAVTLGLAAQAGGLIPENYHAGWTADFTYIGEQEAPHPFRSGGLIPGHQFKWCRLLLTLERYCRSGWMEERAAELYRAALDIGWDRQLGGIFSLTAWDGAVLNSDKPCRAMAEALGASALMAVQKNCQNYWNIYNTLFDYCRSFLIDPDSGLWYPVLNRENQRYAYPGYDAGEAAHAPVENCYEIIKAMNFFAE